MTDYYAKLCASVPPQPPESAWRFIGELKSPLHAGSWRWERWRAQHGEVELRHGVVFEPDFPDAAGLLETACADFNKFLDYAGLRGKGGYSICLKHTRMPVGESFCVEVARGKTVLAAGDTEGIRRGLIYLEDEFLRRGGPFLPLGVVRRTPVVRTRISRCFFGPINRPPKCRDELADDVDYYPDEYLNRLAHDGINGLWLTIKFADTVPSRIIPEYGCHAEARLNKLRRTVQKCLRYGIKIYAFCIEPASFALDSPVLAAHPELGGHRTTTHAAFCPSSKLGQAYLEEAAHTLFARVSGLGGLIDITVGERFTHCASSAVDAINCPRCKGVPPWEILGRTQSALVRGMQLANPGAEFISWPYAQKACWGEKLAIQAAGHIPPGVIHLQNFETGGRSLQLGKERRANDYWLSYAGPSDLFRDCARRATRKSTRVFAKLQAACSHEVATVPYVPVPGQLYLKYKAMHQLGVSGAMLCWYFGNYPSPMNKAACELSFAPFPKNERAFRMALARRYWGADAHKAAMAWRYFQRAYQNYPLDNFFGYFGPMHDGPVWPLLLKPANAILAQTFQLFDPPSGDRVGEAFPGGHTWREILILCGRLTRIWRRGLNILETLDRPALNAEQRRDLTVARALDLQFRSGYNIMRFYALREKMIDSHLPRRARFLKDMRVIVEEELRNNRKLLALTMQDATLGFHSEAEGYKYFPAKIRWRMRHLKHLLRYEFKKMEALARKPGDLFPEYTGVKPVGAVVRCVKLLRPLAMSAPPQGAVWDAMSVLELNCQIVAGKSGKAIVAPNPEFKGIIKLGWTERYLYIGVICRAPAESLQNYPERHNLLLQFEPMRLFPGLRYSLYANGDGKSVVIPASWAPRPAPWDFCVQRQAGKWSGVIRIPMVGLFGAADAPRPIRFSALFTWHGATERRFAFLVPPCPLPNSRQGYGNFNPNKELGWLQFV